MLIIPFLNAAFHFSWWYLMVLFFIEVFVYDLFISKKHTIQKIFSNVGHLRYIHEEIGPELRQCIMINNREDLPCVRLQRSWIDGSSKKENNNQRFSSSQDQGTSNCVFIQASLFPSSPSETSVITRPSFPFFVTFLPVSIAINIFDFLIDLLLFYMGELSSFSSKTVTHAGYKDPAEFSLEDIKRNTSDFYQMKYLSEICADQKRTVPFESKQKQKVCLSFGRVPTTRKKGAI